MATDFEQAVLLVIAAVAPGEVVTYGEVAAEAGRPGAARAVGRVMATSGATMPWWRVVAADGRLAPGKEADQRRRLRAEGVRTDDRRVLGMGRGGRPAKCAVRPDRQ